MTLTGDLGIFAGGQGTGVTPQNHNLCGLSQGSGCHTDPGISHIRNGISCAQQRAQRDTAARPTCKWSIPCIHGQCHTEGHPCVTLQLAIKVPQFQRQTGDHTHECAAHVLQPSSHIRGRSLAQDSRAKTNVRLASARGALVQSSGARHDLSPTQKLDGVDN